MFNSTININDSETYVKGIGENILGLCKKPETLHIPEWGCQYADNGDRF